MRLLSKTTILSIPFLLLLSLSLSPLIHANPYATHPKSPIQDLTTTPKFDAALLQTARTAPLLLVHFHGRCSACEDLASGFVLAAEQAGEASGADTVLRDVIFGRVDSKGNEELMGRYGVLGNGPSTAGSDSPLQKKEDTKTKSIPGFPILVFTSSAEEPLVLPLHTTDGKAEVTANAILAFAREQIRLRSPVRSSAAIVEAAVKEKVLALNADTFHGVVEDESKDVFVKFYAPWCSHCKKLAPRYAKVAALFANHPTCMVTTFNADPPAERAIAKQHGIRGFPTLKFYPSKSNTLTNATKFNPEVYRGARSPEALVHFLNERCGTEMVLPTMGEAVGDWVSYLQSNKNDSNVGFTIQHPRER
ncbi:unnamed protein product [Tilletia caries]|nr:unnamed protein product [Tilletia caries]